MITWLTGPQSASVSLISANDVCADLNIDGMKFFRVDARRFFDDLLALAHQGITVYPRSVYGK